MPGADAEHARAVDPGCFRWARRQDFARFDQGRRRRGLGLLAFVNELRVGPVGECERVGVADIGGRQDELLAPGDIQVDRSGAVVATKVPLPDGDPVGENLEANLGGGLGGRIDPRDGGKPLRVREVPRHASVHLRADAVAVRLFADAQRPLFRILVRHGPRMLVAGVTRIHLLGQPGFGAEHAGRKRHQQGQQQGGDSHRNGVDRDRPQRIQMDRRPQGW